MTLCGIQKDNTSGAASGMSAQTAGEGDSFRKGIV